MSLAEAIANDAIYFHNTIHLHDAIHIHDAFVVDFTDISLLFYRCNNATTVTMNSDVPSVPITTLAGIHSLTDRKCLLC